MLAAGNCNILHPICPPRRETRSAIEVMMLQGAADEPCERDAVAR